MLEFDGLKAGMKVQTPVGVGRVTDRVIIPQSPDGVLVVFRRDDFTPEDWEIITPYNDPCVFRVYPPDQVDLLDAVVNPATVKEIEALMPKPEFASAGYHKNRKGKVRK